MSTPEQEPRIRNATVADRVAVQALVEPFIRNKVLLPRTFSELTGLLAKGYVAEHQGRVVGFAALEVYSPKLAEIRSLAVDPSVQGRGVGRLLVEACLQQARRDKILEVMAISSSESFFISCGFDFTLPGEKKAFFYTTREP